MYDSVLRLLAIVAVFLAIVAFSPVQAAVPSSPIQYTTDEYGDADCDNIPNYIDPIDDGLCDDEPIDEEIPQVPEPQPTTIPDPNPSEDSDTTTDQPSSPTQVTGLPNTGAGHSGESAAGFLAIAWLSMTLIGYFVIRTSTQRR